MDVDVGSTAVARNVIGLVISYVKALVVDLAILIEVSPSSVRATMRWQLCVELELGVQHPWVTTT